MTISKKCVSGTSCESQQVSVSKDCVSLITEGFTREISQMWIPFDNGASIGTTGSENGTIIKDEEHPQGARITLEKNGHTPYSITCGIYGSMCHTAFAGDFDKAAELYEAMKQEIDRFLSADDIDWLEWATRFTERF